MTSKTIAPVKSLVLWIRGGQTAVLQWTVLQELTQSPCPWSWAVNQLNHKLIGESPKIRSKNWYECGPTDAHVTLCLQLTWNANLTLWDRVSLRFRLLGVRSLLRSLQCFLMLSLQYAKAPNSP